jgi:predicted nucleic acid-binding Zn ribbon protein
MSIDYSKRDAMPAYRISDSEAGRDQVMQDNDDDTYVETKTNPNGFFNDTKSAVSLIWG